MIRNRRTLRGVDTEAVLGGRIKPMANPIPKENYIYFHHLGKGLTIPVDPQSIADSMGAGWATSTPLSRSAPIYSYSNSGPRTVLVNFQLHRDLVREFNPDWVKQGEDVVELLIQNIEACVLPTYQETGKIVNPPVVSLKIRDEIYIKGTVGNVSKDFQIPIINYGTATAPNWRYALVDLNFSVSEVTPYDASIINGMGGNRTHSALNISWR